MKTICNFCSVVQKFTSCSKFIESVRYWTAKVQDTVFLQVDTSGLVVLFSQMVLFLQETSFAGGANIVTRKVSSTSVKSGASSASGPSVHAQSVTVTRSVSDVNNKQNSATRVNGERHDSMRHDVSPWQVSPVINDTPASHAQKQKAPPQPPARRLHLTTEL